MKDSEKVRIIAEILKERFPNLTVKEVVDLAFKILERIED